MINFFFFEFIERKGSRKNVSVPYLISVMSSYCGRHDRVYCQGGGRSIHREGATNNVFFEFKLGRIVLLVHQLAASAAVSYWTL
jgi:hypothetical protein